MKKRKNPNLTARLANKPLSLHKQILKHIHSIRGGEPVMKDSGGE